MASDRISEVYLGKALSKKAQEVARKRITWIAERATGKRVLDIGCSQGVVAVLLARAGKEVLGVDNDPESIAYAQGAAREEPEAVRSRLRFLAGDVLTEDLGEGTFDTVIMGQVLEHVPEPEAFLTLAHERCAKDGRILVTVPFGVLDHPDHQHTFYLSGFSRLVARWFSLVELDVIGKRICFAGTPRQSPLTGQPSLDALEPAWLRRICELEEREFERIEREQLGELARRAERIGRLETRAKKAQARAEKLSSSPVARTRAALSKALQKVPYTRSLRRVLKGEDLRTVVTTSITYERARSRLSRELSPSTTARVLFVPTNGGGLGHLTRAMAVARRMSSDPRVESIAVLTTSNSLQLIQREGFIPYFYPPSGLLRQALPASTWNQNLAALLRMVIRDHGINAVVFDGTYPYAGLRKALTESDVRRIWLQRGLFKAEVEADFQKLEAPFDLVVNPRELGEPERPPHGKHVSVPPIVFSRPEELLTRKEARAELGLGPRKKAVLVQLGAGNINDIDAPIQVVLRALRARKDVAVVVAESPIAVKRIEGLEGATVVRDYPLARYYPAFDFAVSAAGYNSFAEFIQFGVPTVFVPNTSTRTDDQVARAHIAERAGAALVLEPVTPENLAPLLDRMFDEDERARMRERCRSLAQENGAEAAAQAILSHLFAQDPHPAPAGDTTR